METIQEQSFDTLVEQYLGTDLPQHLSGAISLPELPSDTQEFIIRLLCLMKRSGYSATEFSPTLTRWLSTTIPSMLPRAWGGLIPPITVPDRHKKLDDYITKQHWSAGNGPHIFVDIGCGFPPITTADTAGKLPDWQIYGVDRSFADYVLYDSNGHYACFDQEGEFLYFQALMDFTGRALYADPQGTRNRFNRLFADLLSLLKNPDNASSETVEKDGNRLVHHHVRDFETNNLTFIKSDIMDLKIKSAKVIRCMNILIYSTPEIRKKMLVQAGGLLDDDGILIAGTNGIGVQSRYAVYQKGKDSLFPGEFAFSLDNLGHISFMPWFTIHKNDPEAVLLAELSGIIRADRFFWPGFSSRMDELLLSQGICRRGADGFLHFPEEDMAPTEYLKRNAILWEQVEEEGYTDGAVDILGRAGYDAWKNPAGDIAVRPPANCLP